jgi:dihydroorotate dehydrogenase
MNNVAMNFPLYDLQKSFEQNCVAVTKLAISNRVWPEEKKWVSFLGFHLASRVGVSACAVTTGRNLALLAQLGFDVLTYKTIRTRICPAHDLPNILPVYVPEPFSKEHRTQTLRVLTHEEIQYPAIANSFGNACLDPNWVMEDIADAKRALNRGQVLIVSVYGDNEERDLVTDFVRAASMAKEAGADIIELNLSCPNLNGKYLDQDSDIVSRIAQAVNRAIKPTPVLIKLKWCPDLRLITSIMLSAAWHGIVGISAINSIAMPIIDAQNKPAFGAQRLYAGVSGYPLHRLALEFIQTLQQINRRHQLALSIVGMGGITQAEHFDAMFHAGADLALTATGMMFNPYLGMQYQKLAV